MSLLTAPVAVVSYNLPEVLLLLGRVPQATLERAAADPRFLAAYRRACERFDNYVVQFEPPTDRLIAYFSMEYGLVECMPIYRAAWVCCRAII